MRQERRVEPQEVKVPRWRPHIFPFRSFAKHENSFAVTFSGVVKGPDGRRFSTLGFFDGSGFWKLRVSANVVGEWSVRTRSDDPQLDGKTVEFLCVPNEDPKVHGGLLVDLDHPYHFVFEDGTRYFLMGYECDWLWALDMGDLSLPTLNPFLDKIAAHGFNHILLNVYAHDCPWREGRTGNDDYGPPAMHAWEGSNEEPVHNRFNLAYWQHYDRVIDALYRRGIIAHLMIKVYNKMVNWPEKASREDDLYFRWVIARYAAYPNVVWDLTKEGWRDKDLEYKLSRIRLIRRLDPYRRLVTVHDDDAGYESGEYDQLLDFRADQQHSDWHETILSQRRRHRWPAANVEFGYEHGLRGVDDWTYRVVQPPEEVCRRAWEICTAGGYAAYYYTYTAWDVVRPDDTPLGYTYFKHLREYFERIEYWLMEPHDELVSEVYCLADPGKEYVVFLNKPTRITLKIEGASGPLEAEWYLPFTGERVPAGELENGTFELTPPLSRGDTPVALHASLHTKG